MRRVWSKVTDMLDTLPVFISIAVIVVLLAGYLGFHLGVKAQKAKTRQKARAVVARLSPFAVHELKRIRAELAEVDEVERSFFEEGESETFWDDYKVAEHV